MKNVLPFLFFFSIALFTACQGENSQTAATETTTGPAKRPVEDGRIIREQDDSPSLSQEAPISRIELKPTDSLLYVTYLANGKDLQREMVEEEGLSSYEAHLAKMFAIGSTQCFNLPAGQDKIAFILLNNENKLQGRFDLPCNFIRRVYSTMGTGATSDISTQRGNDTAIFTTGLLDITKKKRSLFRNIVQGIEPAAYNGVEIGQKMK